MRTSSHHYVESLLGVRRHTIEVIALAIVLAFGINLASSGLPSLLSLSPQAAAGAGLMLIIVGFVYLLVRLKPLSSRALILRGVLPVSAEKAIEEIPRYDLSERLHDYFSGLTSENKAIAKLWRDAKIDPELNQEESSFRISAGPAHVLVQEALEYFVLDKLSLHLSEYFESNREVDENAIVRIQRSDIPHILLENRFLEQFSRPMELREAFLDHGPDGSNEKVVSATGSDGAVFERFELILPRHSTIMRAGHVALHIATRRFTLTFAPEFHGFSTVFPHKFEELYLGKRFNVIHPYIVTVRVETKFKWWALLTGKGWDYYEWLDSFLDELAASLSFDEFISSIGWDVAVSSAIASENLSRIVTKNAG